MRGSRPRRQVEPGPLQRCGRGGLSGTVKPKHLSCIGVCCSLLATRIVEEESNVPSIHDVIRIDNSEYKKCFGVFRHSRRGAVSLAGPTGSARVKVWTAEAYA
ncbi:cyclin-G2 [Nannospalax galili]|uniref:cyclin-G2 n=1 Tax=Nannospalax galili TaxID=1026970 RepID=UPI00111BFFB3|nr:cyclin-G2 [Nannospalax galili]XP_029424395.1 cyclin-G2 [Nannospalax galili]XP_029424396.1 cyclin-G2 [Nannospalax galili]